MKIGARAHDFGKKDPEVLFGEILKEGYTGVHLALKKAMRGIEDNCDIDEDFIEELGRVIRKTGMEIPVLGCYIEPSYTDEGKRAREVLEFKRQTRFAQALGAGCIGTETTNLEKLQDTRENALEALVLSLREMTRHAEEVGIDVAIEPVHYHVMNTPELTKVVLDRVDSKRLKVIFDPVNLLSPEDVQDQYGLWKRAFQHFGDRIAAVHMKGITFDGQGELVSCALEDSLVDYGYIMKLLKDSIMRGKTSEDIYLLREEVRPEHAKRDADFLRRLVEKDD